MPSEFNSVEQVSADERRSAADNLQGLKVIVFTLIMNLSQDLFHAQVRNHPNVGLVVSALIGALVVYAIPPRETPLTKLLLIAFSASLAWCGLRLLVHSWPLIWNHIR